VRLEGLGQLKKSGDLVGIEPATFQLVAHYLNQLRYRVPNSDAVGLLKKSYSGYQLCQMVTYYRRFGDYLCPAS
jgi:hypothetical protein